MGASGSKTPTIICCGLDAAGKSTMLYQIAQLHHADEPETSIPAIGLNVEALEAGGLRFVSWDLSGAGHSWHRPLWRHYFQSAQCLVFVVDSSDMERIDNAREELSDLLVEEFDGRKDWPVLVLVCVRARGCACRSFPSSPVSSPNLLNSSWRTGEQAGPAAGQDRPQLRGDYGAPQASSAP